MSRKTIPAEAARELMRKIARQDAEDTHANCMEGDRLASTDEERKPDQHPVAAEPRPDPHALLAKLLEKLRNGLEAAREPGLKSSTVARPGEPLGKAVIFPYLQKHLGLTVEQLQVLLPDFVKSRPMSKSEAPDVVGSSKWLHVLATAVSPGGTLNASGFRYGKGVPVPQFLIEEAARRGWPPAIVDVMRIIDSEFRNPEDNAQAIERMLEWLRLLEIQGESEHFDAGDVLIAAAELLMGRLDDVPGGFKEQLADACWARGLDPAVRLHRFKPKPAKARGHVFACRPPLVAAGREETEAFKAFDCLAKPMPLREIPGDLKAVEDALNRRAPHARTVTRYLVSGLEAQRRCGNPFVRLPHLLIHGAAGIGKDDYLVALAGLLELPYRIHNLGGASDNREFEGTARGWGTSCPSLIANHIRDSQVANLVLGLSEVEKFVAGGWNGNTHHTLLAMLEPLTAQAWRDAGLGVDLDLRPVNFLATANSLDGIPRPLLSRFTVLHMPAPEGDDYYPIVRSMFTGQARSRGIEESVEPDAFEWEVLQRAFCIKPDLRALGRTVARLLDERETGERRPKQ